MTDDIPQWAKDRAVELTKACGHQYVDCSAVDAFARYIAEHEEPPVDPLLVEAREIVADWWDRNPARFPGSNPSDYRAGKRDAGAEVEQALAALKRGMELARTQSGSAEHD